MRPTIFAMAIGLYLAAEPIDAQQGPSPVAESPVAARTATAHTPNIKPTLAATRATGPITIDGDLTDAGWVGAARASNFSEFNPRDLGAPSVETEAWITYDQSHLYVALIARDDPATIRSSLTDRDKIWQDDYVGVLLDTYADASWAYSFFANPKGIQGDERFAEGQGSDARLDLIYHSRGRITDDGYVVEMAIPFSSLRFPAREVQQWGITFWRNRPRGTREQISWAGVSRRDPCVLCQFGTLTGLEGVRPGGSLEILPSVVSSQAGARSAVGQPFANGKLTADAGVTARYAFANGVTAEATINPDFSQVESDAGQVDVNSTFALFFPEQRTFFQEGSDLFSTRLRAVHTRTINKPLAAAKLIGRMGRTTVAYLGARDDISPVLLPFEERSASGQAGRSVSNVVRVRQTFGRNSSIGALLTDRRLDGGGGGSVAGVDGRVQLDRIHGLGFQLLGSATREPDAPTLLPNLDGVTFDRGRHTAQLDGERFTGLAYQASLTRETRAWNWDVTYRSISPTFRADNGFETRNNLRTLMSYQSYVLYPNGRIVQRIEPTVIGQRTWNFEGDRKSQALEAQLSANLVGQTFAQVIVRTADERFRGVDFTGLQRLAIRGETKFSRVVETGGMYAIGDGVARTLATPVVGSLTDINWWVRFRPTTWATVNPSIVHSRLTDPAGATLHDGYIFRTRTDLQFTRELFMRMVVQYNDFTQQLAIEPLVTYRANPFTMVYVGSTRNYLDDEDASRWTRTATQYFMKVQYLLKK